MRVRMVFNQTSDERFLVISEETVHSTYELHGRFTVSAYDHEDMFLRMVIAAGLDDADAAEVIGNVLLTVSRPVYPPRWVDLDLTPEQGAALGLEREGGALKKLPRGEPTEQAASALADGGLQFYEFLMQAPTPFAMFSGPEHQFLFANPAYLQMIGQTTLQEIFGRSLLQVLPELEGQAFYEQLGKVYRTGNPAAETGVATHLPRSQRSGSEERFFDYTYHPVRDAAGAVSGIMVQATDVSEKVLSREVSDHRETQLYRQWAELDTIYRTAPVGMVLFDARSFRILRINEKQAELMGASIGELLGKSVLEVDSMPALRVLFRQVAAGEKVRNTVMEEEVGSGEPRTWLMNVSPSLSASGQIEVYSAISLEIPREMRRDPGLAEVDRLAAAIDSTEAAAGRAEDVLQRLRVHLRGLHEGSPQPQMAEAIERIEQELQRLPAARQEASVG